MIDHESLMVRFGKFLEQRVDRKAQGLAVGGPRVDGVRNGREVVGEDVQGGRETCRVAGRSLGSS